MELRRQAQYNFQIIKSGTIKKREVGGNQYFIKMRVLAKVDIHLQTKLIIYVMLLIKKQNLKLLEKMVCYHLKYLQQLLKAQKQGKK